mgnify:CR=1 FL=1
MAFQRNAFQDNAFQILRLDTSGPGTIGTLISTSNDIIENERLRELRKKRLVMIAREYIKQGMRWKRGTMESFHGMMRSYFRFRPHAITPKLRMFPTKHYIRYYPADMDTKRKVKMLAIQERFR